MIPSASPESVGMSSERLSLLKGWMQSYVDEGKLPGCHTVIARRGKLVYSDYVGQRDIAGNLPTLDNGIYRIYSMTKLITTVAAMMLYEEGRFQLDNPISRFLPGFADMKVGIVKEDGGLKLEDADGPITIQQLMTHTSGFTYGLFDEGPIGAILREQKVDFGNPNEALADTAKRLADVPICFQPGSRWNYSVSTDVLGHIVEIISGMSLWEFMKSRIFDPLGMVDTHFSLPEADKSRFSVCYRCDEDNPLAISDTIDSTRFGGETKMYSGGGGLLSTIADYHRFIEMLRGKGELNGVRLLGRKTVEHMMTNQLPGDMASMGQPSFSEMPMTGIGFGLGGAVMLEPAKATIMGSPGEFSWGGLASTGFFIDPVEELTVVFMTQLMPSSTYPLRRELRVLTYQALVD